jgi:hypothetical protein
VTQDSGRTAPAAFHRRSSYVLGTSDIRVGRCLSNRCTSQPDRCCRITCKRKRFLCLSASLRIQLFVQHACRRSCRQVRRTPLQARHLLEVVCTRCSDAACRDQNCRESPARTSNVWCRCSSASHSLERDPPPDTAFLLRTGASYVLVKGDVRFAILIQRWIACPLNAIWMKHCRHVGIHTVEGKQRCRHSFSTLLSSHLRPSQSQSPVS